MSFTFTPMTEEELQMMSLIPAGIYDFKVVKATQKLSRSGNQMIELQLMIWDREGKTHLIYDYLVSIASMVYKIKHFCDAVGLADDYKTGTFDVVQCEGRSGKANIIIQHGKPNPVGGNYPDKKAVKDYVMKPIAVINDQLTDDEIPF